MSIEDWLREAGQAGRRGDYRKQVALLNRALGAVRQRHDALAEAEVLRQMGNAHHEQGDLRQAHSCRVEAGKLAASFACPLELRMAIEGDLGRSYLEVGLWERAEEHTQQALEGARYLHDTRAESLYLINLSLAYMNTGRQQQAEAIYEQIRHAGERQEDHYILGLCYLNLARWRLNEVRLNETQRYARRCMYHATQRDDARMRLQATQILGHSLFIAYQLIGSDRYGAESIHYLGEAAREARSLGVRRTELEAEQQLAQLHEARHEPDVAIRHHWRVLDILEELRSGLGYEEFQISYFKSYEPTYERIASYLLRNRHADDAFRTAERLRSRLLLASLGSGRASTNSWIQQKRHLLNQILAEYGGQVVAALRGGDVRGLQRNRTVGVRSGTASGAGSQAREMSDMPRGLNHARRQFLDLYEEQRLHQAHWLGGESPDGVSWSQTQHYLRPGDALISYLITDDSLVIFASTAKKRHFQHLSYSRSKLHADVEEVCRAMDALRDEVLRDGAFLARTTHEAWPVWVAQRAARLDRQLEKLYALLIAPILPVVHGAEHWIIVPQGSLHRLPWAALRGMGRYLIEEHTLSLLPSASLGVAVQSLPQSSTHDAFFFGDPDPDDEFLQLPGAQAEVRAAHQVIGRGPTPFIGPAANKSEFLRGARSARVLHAACHHFFDAQSPLLSFLKLAGEAGHDSLYAFEIAALELSAQLVCLSACESGLSGITTGDEQIGIVRAFLAAGAKSVVSTLWCIEDLSAAEFFSSFYHGARSEDLARALAKSQRSLLGDPRFSLPYFWAPYILSGRWFGSLRFGADSS